VSVALCVGVPGIGGGGGGGGDVLLSDLFTDANGTAPGAHTMDVGAGWTVHAGTWSIQSNKLRKTATDNTFETVTADAGNADGIVTCAVTAPATSAGGLFLRSSNGNTGWLVQVFESGAPASFALYEDNAGVFTLRASSNPTLTPGQTYTVQVILSGAAITCTLDGGNSMSYALASFNQTEDRMGLLSYDLNMDFDTFLMVGP
jgi:hypothetical protein